MRAVQGWYKKKAKEQGFGEVQGGSVSFIQKFGSSLNATPHYHCLLLDGGYTFSDDSNEPFFVATPPPPDEDVKQIAETVAARAIRLLERQGVIGEQDAYDAFSEENPVLAGMTAASVRGMIAKGDRAGPPVRRVLSDPARGVRTSPLCYVSPGFCFAEHLSARVPVVKIKVLLEVALGGGRTPPRWANWQFLQRGIAAQVAFFLAVAPLRRNSPVSLVRAGPSANHSLANSPRC